MFDLSTLSSGTSVHPDDRCLSTLWLLGARALQDTSSRRSWDPLTWHQHYQWSTTPKDWSVHLPIRQSVIWMDVVVDVWNNLKTRYSQGDLSRISDLQLVASSLSQNDLSVTDYFTKLIIIWDELDNFRPNLIYVC